MKQLKIIRPIALCVVLILLLLLFPATAIAATEGTCGENVAWTLDDTGTLIISGTGPMKDYIGSEPPWYALRNTVTEVVVEDGVTYVGAWSLINMRSVTSVTIGKDVTEIGEFAFSCSNVNTVILPKGLQVIGESAFEYCDMLSQIDIPDSVVTIGVGAFSSNYSLQTVTLGSGITSIGDLAFADCLINNVYYRGTKEAWSGVTVGSYNDGLLDAQWHFAKKVPGDVNSDTELTTDDAVYLLLATMFGDTNYPIPTDMNCDYNSDGKENTDDAIYLLLHTMFGEKNYPLPV